MRTTNRIKLGRTTSLGSWGGIPIEKRSFYEKSTGMDISLNDRTKISNKKQAIVVIDRSVASTFLKTSTNDLAKSKLQVELSSRLFNKETSKTGNMCRSACPLIKKVRSSFTESSTDLKMSRNSQKSRQTQILIGKLENAIKYRINGSISKSRNSNVGTTLIKTQSNNKPMTIITSGNAVIQTVEREKLHKLVESDTNLELLNYDGKELSPYLKSKFLNDKQYMDDYLDISSK